MKKKIYRILLLLAIVLAMMIIVGEIAKAVKKHKQSKNDANREMLTDASETDATGDDASNSDASNSDAESLSYAHKDVEIRILMLANSEEQTESLTRLIDPLNKSQAVDVSFVKKVVQAIDVDESVYAEELSGMNDNSLVTKEQFDSIYDNIVETGVVKGLLVETKFIFDTYFVTENGKQKQVVFDGFDTYDLLVDCVAVDGMQTVYMKDNSIFYAKEARDTNITLENVWVVDSDSNSVSFVYENLEKTYPVAYSVLEASDLNDKVEKLQNKVATITFGTEGIVELHEQKNVMTATVLTVMDEELSVLNKGNYSIDPNFQIYDTYGEFSCSKSSQLLTGHKEVELILSGKTVIAAIISDELQCDNIRVILSNDDYTSYDMEEVILAFPFDTTIVDSEENESYMEAGSSITYTASDYEKGEVISVTPNEIYGYTIISSLHRSYGNPEYMGTIELRFDGDHIHIINEVPLEEYLYSVVASEMPVTYEMEALKAGAICARGYAYSKMLDNSFSAYDADLDDSTLCQVYNNVKENPQTIEAVRETYSIVPVYDENVIVPLYFSTSCGMSCTNADIWGGEKYPYLESNVENLDKDKVDLSEEDTFRQFMEDSLGYDTIEKDMPYYRWQVSFTTEEISKAISSTLADRIAMSPDNITVENNAGKFVKKDISDIGQIKDIQVETRTASGVVETLIIEGTEATIKVTGQTNIRNLISPYNQEIMKQDGSSVKNWTSLPSPYYYIVKEGEIFTIYGGGFGHGVGMSQNGAMLLAEQGYNYKYILHHYYTYITFDTIYSATEESEE